MGLEGPLLDFWYAESALCPVVMRTPWGAVKTDPRYPLIWDANHAAVYREAPGLTLKDLTAELVPALRAAGAMHLHAEFWGITGSCPALDALRDLSGGGGHTLPSGTEGSLGGWKGARALEADVVMVLEADPGVGPTGEVEVRELTEPDEAFWAWYRGTRQEFGVEFTDPVVDQLVHRDQVIFHPAGLRWFVGYVDGTMAGFTSLLTLAGVGYLDNVVTLPAFRRRGVAAATVRAAVRSGLGHGARQVHLLAEEGSGPERLYERLGFRMRHRVESFNRRLGPERADAAGPGRASSPAP